MNCHPWSSLLWIFPRTKALRQNAQIFLIRFEIFKGLKENVQRNYKNLGKGPREIKIRIKVPKISL